MMKQRLDESENVVMVASNNRAFVSRVIPMLASMEDTLFTVYGLESWNRFSSLDEIELNLLKVHYPSVFFQDENQLFYDFRNNYHHRFKEYPSKYAYAAYKQFLFLIADGFTDFIVFRKFEIIKAGSIQGFLLFLSKNINSKLLIIRLLISHIKCEFEIF